MKFRGHTLVWQGRLPPPWFAGYINPQNAKVVDARPYRQSHGTLCRQNSISGMLLTKLPLAPGQNSVPDGLRDTPWLRNLGPGYIEMAFRAAAQADSHALLTWNENWLEESSPFWETPNAHFGCNI